MGGGWQYLLIVAPHYSNQGVQGKGSGKWGEANRRHELQTATQPGVMPTSPPPPLSPLEHGRKKVVWVNRHCAGHRPKRLRFRAHLRCRPLLSGKPLGGGLDPKRKCVYLKLAPKFGLL